MADNVRGQELTWSATGKVKWVLWGKERLHTTLRDFRDVPTSLQVSASEQASLVTF